MQRLDPLHFKARFVTEPEGASIIMDGRDTGIVTPALIEVGSGFHRYKLLLDGHEYAEGRFNPFGWKDFTANVYHVFKKRNKPRVNRTYAPKKEPKKYDPLNPLTWKKCPECGAKVSENAFRYRKHECECKKCRTVFQIPRAFIQKVPLKPWDDPQSLFCSKKLKDVTDKEPLSGDECRG